MVSYKAFETKSTWKRFMWVDVKLFLFVSVILKITENWINSICQRPNSCLSDFFQWQQLIEIPQVLSPGELRLYYIIGPIKMHTCISQSKFTHPLIQSSSSNSQWPSCLRAIAHWYVTRIILANIWCKGHITIHFLVYNYVFLIIDFGVVLICQQLALTFPLACLS